MTKFRTRQEIFNLAYIGLKKQGFQRSFDNYGCAYRGKNNRRCAIGFCIEDGDYHDGLEARSASDPEVMAAARISTEDKDFAALLQSQHDFCGVPEQMKEKLHEFAETFELTVPA